MNSHIAVSMTSPVQTIRRAMPEDAMRIAELTNLAGHGLPLQIWRDLAATGDDPFEIGAERIAAKLTEQTVFAVDPGDGAIATLIGYPQPDEPAPIPDDMPAVCVPLQKLENLVPGSWYVNILAVLPDHRGQGWGSTLLTLADAMAIRDGCRKLSVIVENANHGARRLFERHGYAEVAHRPLVGDWGTDSTEWLLMVKRL